MKALLGSLDAWEVTNDGFEDPGNTTGLNAAQTKALKETRSKDKTALYMLFRAVDESAFEKIVGSTTSKGAWDTLEKAYRGADRVKQVRLQTLRGEMERMKMKETESVADYITRVQTVANQMSRNGETMTEGRIVEKILRSLTDKFENIVCAIEEAKDLSTITVEEVAGSLEAHKQRKMKKKEEVIEEADSSRDEKALFSQNWRGRGRGHGGRDGGRSYQNYSFDRGQSSQQN